MPQIVHVWISPPKNIRKRRGVGGEFFSEENSRRRTKSYWSTPGEDLVLETEKTVGILRCKPTARAKNLQKRTVS